MFKIFWSQDADIEINPAIKKLFVLCGVIGFVFGLASFSLYDHFREEIPFETKERIKITSEADAELRELVQTVLNGVKEEDKDKYFYDAGWEEYKVFLNQATIGKYAQTRGSLLENTKYWAGRKNAKTQSQQIIVASDAKFSSSLGDMISGESTIRLYIVLIPLEKNSQKKLKIEHITQRVIEPYLRRICL